MAKYPNKFSQSGSSTGHISPDLESPIYDLWRKRGEDDISYQRQAQVTWWTLLGGIALAALLTQFESMLNEVKVGGWFYLFYFFANCFIIINSWVQTSWGALVLRWPISVPTSIHLFFGGLASSIAALNIMNPPSWYAAVGFVILSAVLMQLNFMKHQGWVAMPPETIRRVRQGIAVYVALIIFCFMASVVLFFFPFDWIKIAGGAAGFTLSIAALYWQHLGMKYEKRKMGIA